MCGKCNFSADQLVEPLVLCWAGRDIETWLSLHIKLGYGKVF